jgi:hypothetical protein
MLDPEVPVIFRVQLADVGVGTSDGEGCEATEFVGIEVGVSVLVGLGEFKGDTVGDEDCVDNGGDDVGLRVDTGVALDLRPEIFDES